MDLIDKDFQPDPHNPATGDIYSRPTALGWDRLVVIRVETAHTVPASHDISLDVRIPCQVTFIDNAMTMRRTADEFRAWLVSRDMKPTGRMARPVSASA